MSKKTFLRLVFSGALFVIHISSVCGQDFRYEALKALERKWGGNADFAREPIQFAAQGHTIVSAPQRGAQVIKRIEEPGMVNVAVQITNSAGTFYISDWSWNRYLKGIQPNWVTIPAGTPRSAGNAAAFWNLTYEQLKHDETRRNCHAAYGYLLKNRADPAVVKLCAERYPKEQDIQAKSAALAVLCKSPVFKHDESFYRDVLDHLLVYRRAKLGFWSQGHPPSPGWIENWLHSYLRGLGSAWSEFIVRNGSKYQRVLPGYLKTDDMLVKWLVTHTLARHDLIGTYKSSFDDQFYSVVFSKLRSDKESFNAVYATRTLLILRPFSDPYVDARLRRPLDDQERMILTLFQRDLTRPENRKAYEVTFTIGNLRSNLFGSMSAGDAYEYELKLFSNLAPYNPY